MVNSVEGATHHGDGAHRAIAVIVQWGDPEATFDLATEHLASGAFDHVVVVANDGRVATRTDSRISWKTPSRNLGYGAACQWAAMNCPARLYAFLNTDVRLADDAAKRCLDALLLPETAVAGPLLLHDDGSLQSGCGTWTCLLRRPRADAWPTTGVSCCEWITGAALFCRREVVTEVGFDGSYFLGNEDADLCDRVRERGWRVAIVRDARGYHQGGATMTGGRWQYYTVRNRIWFARKRRRRSAAMASVVWAALVLLPRIALADTIKRRSYSLTYSAYRGVVDGMAKLPAFGEPWPHEPVPRAWMEWS